MVHHPLLSQADLLSVAMGSSAFSGIELNMYVLYIERIMQHSFSLAFFQSARYFEIRPQRPHYSRMFLSQARSQVSAWLSWSGVPPSLALVSNLEWEGAPRVSGSSAGGGRRYGKGRDQHGHSASLGSLPLPSRSEGVEGWDQTGRSAPAPSGAAGLPWPSPRLP